MARKAGIYITEPIDALLKGREDHDSLSGRISTICERYRMILDAHRPDMTDAEWNACRDALNGVWLRDGLSLRSIWAEIADADRIGGLGKKWGLDGQALAVKIRDLPVAALVALVEAVEQWWASNG